MLRKAQCQSRVWTPEHGDDSWVSCTRRDHHRGDHRGGFERWTSGEADRALAAAAASALRAPAETLAPAVQVGSWSDTAVHAIHA